LVSTVAAQDVEAIIIEVLQGEGGIVPCPPDYLRGLREVCDEHGILLICDEVQSGFCRTGAWAAYQHADIVPDLSCWAKAMGGGLPISAVIGSAEVMSKAAPGTIGGTYGGNPIACASALATIRIMEDSDLCGRARAIGDEVTRRLEPWVQKLDYVGELRGMGAMMALEMVEDGDPQRPATAMANRVVSRCHESGLLILTAGPQGNVVRLLPPLTISDDELDRALSILEDAIVGVG
jgi:4-aminobutyrate aminotransferase/(S)-3-amino-2-methylpropionate transaminase